MMHTGHWRWSASTLALVVVYGLLTSSSVSTQGPPAGPTVGSTTSRGEAWFYQRCSLCHMGRIVKDDTYEPMGPRLTGVLKSASPEREKAVRAQIQRGSPRMPGFQYSFTPAEFEELMAYLKTM